MPDVDPTVCSTCGGRGFRWTNDGHGRQVEERCPTCLPHGPWMAQSERRTFSASADVPISPERLAELATDGWSLAGGWGLNRGYGRLAVNLEFVRTKPKGADDA